ncbi:hypothetical protein SKAU_G00303580 [Synaphobranchus kaupii]|uniref:Uncharacterized protein n=1 Tax=Synaphobranchus kaupii TaxID=118154 RepID=A0A9Q1ILD8_SYNKA|nr:hypothetical protein SKAU_G00303580 [Synaphobranchus kaupii]
MVLDAGLAAQTKRVNDKSSPEPALGEAAGASNSLAVGGQPQRSWEMGCERIGRVFEDHCTVALDRELGVFDVVHYDWLNFGRGTTLRILDPGVPSSSLPGYWESASAVSAPLGKGWRSLKAWRRPGSPVP